jgi:Domain of unknown function (DUF3598)
MRILVTQPNMNSNWDNFLKNLGEWNGSFTNVSSAGEILDSTPSILNLTGLEDNNLVTFRLRRFPAGGDGEQPISDTRAEYRSLGKQAVFFDTGAFSKGLVPSMDLSLPIAACASSNYSLAEHKLTLPV